MRRHEGHMFEDLGIGFPLAALLPLFVGAAMVTVRGEVSSAVTALVLALTVALGARIGGRPGGVVGAFVAAASFDFFHTVPYQSLKIANADDILTTLLLLAVGLYVGSLAARMDQTVARTDIRGTADNAVHRVLSVAAVGPTEDVELAVRAELLKLLDLDECVFTPDAVALPDLGRPGHPSVVPQVYRDGGFELPAGGVVVPVQAHGRLLGNLVCRPHAHAGISAASRRAAVALAEVLGLALDARAA